MSALIYSGRHIQKLNCGRIPSILKIGYVSRLLDKVVSGGSIGKRILGVNMNDWKLFRPGRIDRKASRTIDKGFRGGSDKT